MRANYFDVDREIVELTEQVLKLLSQCWLGIDAVLIVRCCCLGVTLCDTSSMRIRFYPNCI